jgi:glycosyltransferase involved in cell wall biosynthesis
LLIPAESSQVEFINSLSDESFDCILIDSHKSLDRGLLAKCVTPKLKHGGYPSIRVVIVGKDSTGNLEAKLRSLGEYRDNLLVFPPLPQNDLFAILSGATAAIFPTLVDNLPNAVIESLQHGIPVIGSNGASIDELVEDGITGELVEMKNREQLSNLIVKFWRGKSLARRGFRWGGLRDVLDEEATLHKLFQPRSVA